jgi:hypothetical protein
LDGPPRVSCQFKSLTAHDGQIVDDKDELKDSKKKDEMKTMTSEFYKKVPLYIEGCA